MREVFDDPDLELFYRAANAIKINTKKELIRRELLFKEGDVFDQFLLEESERNLRALQFIRRVSLIPIQNGDMVDVLVSVQDTWTLFLNLQFSLGGGSDKKAFGIGEENLLGYGKRAEVLVADDEGRDKIEGVYDDLRFLGTHQRFQVGHFQRSDGFRNAAFYGRPFRSLVEPYSWGMTTDFFDLVGRLFEDADEEFIYRQKSENFGIGYTASRREGDEKVHRYTLGYDYAKDEFSEADDEDFEDSGVNPDGVSRDPALLADDREFSGPFVGYQRIIPDFISLNFLDRFERIQDLNLGNVFTAKLGFAAEELGSENDTLLFWASNSDGFRISPLSFVRGQIGAKGRLDKDGFESVLMQSEAKYYHVFGAKYWRDIYLGKHTLAVSLLLDYGEDFDRDQQLLLGASSGLRAYEERTFTGDKSVVLNIEERAHFVDDVLKIFSVGSVFFVDVGGVTERSMGRLFTDEIYADVGAGLRFGFPRSSGGSVIRIDVAFPLREGPDGSDRFEPRLLISTGQLIDANLRPAIAGPIASSLRVGAE